MKQPGLRETKQLQAKQAIFEAAMALFAEQGFDETSVEQIATRAGVSRATYFNYFGTKTGVLRFYGERLADRLTALSAEVARGARPLERLRRFIEAWAAYASENREHARIVQLYSGREPGYLTGLTPARKVLMGLLVGLVEEGQAAGELRRDLSAVHMAIHTTSIFYNALGIHVMAGEPVAPLMESAWRIVLGGIRHGDGPAE
ncbi:MAG: fadR [Symbiobacteriaceae bacterium]|jgi:AcrR family transcriptional regulator|nr:fadR [Symbiobacteriaceae bacterium]